MVELSTSSPRPAVTGMSLFVAGLGILALIAPLRAAESPATRVGTLLALAALIELLHGSRRATVETRRAALIGGVISLLMGLLLISAPFLAGAALFIVLAGWFAIDGIRYSIKAVRAGDPATRRQAVLAAAGNLSVTVLILITRDFAATWTIAIAGALRIFGIVWNMLVAPVYASGDAEQTVLDDLGLADLPGMSALAAEAETQERLRAPIDRGWTIAFIATLFAIHVSRMESWDGTLLGFVAPGVAVLGDMAIAVIVALAIINPLFLSWRGATRWIERRIWRWYLPTDVQRRGLLARAAGAWLRYRLRISIRFREARYSLSFALRSFLTTGLPYAAIIAATAPVFGMSWYFDTENWAAGIWNSWAESRTDEWREAMVRSVRLQPGAPDDSVIFAVTPPGTSGSGDFAFIVIGDTGEGDASQHSLRDQLLTVAAREDVRFVVISSDVVYPTGSMQVYEPNFWLPFKGVTKPVYAIPGNHDWYDALEAFLATFLQADAARASMRARAEADLRLTSTELRPHRVPDPRGRTAAAAIRCADRVPARAVLRDPDGSFCAARDRHRDHQADRSGGGRLAQRRPRTCAGKDVDGDPRASLLRRRARRDDRQSALRGAETASGRSRRDDPDGRRYARSRVLLGSRGRRSRRPLLRQRWRRRVSELRDIARVAGAHADVRLGVLSELLVRNPEDRVADTLVEAPRVVVDAGAGRVAILRGVAVGRVRFQRLAVLSELCRGAGRAVSEPREDPAVRGARPAAMARSAGVCRLESASATKTRSSEWSVVDEVMVYPLPFQNRQPAPSVSRVEPSALG